MLLVLDRIDDATPEFSIDGRVTPVLDALVHVLASTFLIVRPNPNGVGHLLITTGKHSGVSMGLSGPQASFQADGKKFNGSLHPSYIAEGAAILSARKR